MRTKSILSEVWFKTYNPMVMSQTLYTFYYFDVLPISRANPNRASQNIFVQVDVMFKLIMIFRLSRSHANWR